MNEALPQSYIDKNNKLAAEQLIIASIRLAMVIENIFGSAKAIEEQYSFLQWEYEFLICIKGRRWCQLNILKILFYLSTARDAYAILNYLIIIEM